MLTEKKALRQPFENNLKFLIILNKKILEILFLRDTVMFTLVSVYPIPSLDILKHLFKFSYFSSDINKDVAISHIPLFYKANARELSIIVLTNTRQIAVTRTINITASEDTFISLLGLLSSSPDVMFTLGSLGPSIPYVLKQIMCNLKRISSGPIPGIMENKIVTKTAIYANLKSSFANPSNILIVQIQHRETSEENCLKPP
ncbi:hypothetical protein BpHYR1_024072 [Brachionus plicatilis]|uniref:Uncharacterized protein n=1 Tax=Brachionus plicatilis TaxID=10195 RepID=A0A3M7P5C6_BRAPC|nr:hypothetical protein BpHYR1_024072 [Brachionus plicatilis]